MPSLREIRDHIQSVEGITRIIRALEVVSAANAHRLQDRIEQTRGYAVKSWELLSHLASCDDPAVTGHVVFRGYPEGGPVALILISSNRGMAGNYDHNVTEVAWQYIQRQERSVELITIGKRGSRTMARRGIRIYADFSHLDEHSRIEDVAPIATLVLEGFLNRTFGRVAIAYTEYHAGARLRPRVLELLPIQGPQVKRRRHYYFEPDPLSLLETLVPRIVRFQIYVALLESLAAENTSRAVAMSSATANAKDIVKNLRQTYHKARQQAITEELIELFAGLAALEYRRS